MIDDDNASVEQRRRPLVSPRVPPSAASRSHPAGSLRAIDQRPAQPVRTHRVPQRRVHPRPSDRAPPAPTPTGGGGTVWNPGNARFRHNGLGCNVAFQEWQREDPCSSTPKHAVSGSGSSTYVDNDFRRSMLMIKWPGGGFKDSGTSRRTELSALSVRHEGRLNRGKADLPHRPPGFPPRRSVVCGPSLTARSTAVFPLYGRLAATYWRVPYCERPARHGTLSSAAHSLADRCRDRSLP
jgi:hypothetical protein